MGINLSYKIAQGLELNLELLIKNILKVQQILNFLYFIRLKKIELSGQ